ncbi:dihydropteroate synthase [Maritimibacter alkaliphilus HTCC2654]|uniref:Dihydropteroate synthase n=1 Tax=Maritimibacter alkaliphilus HTCC2654 TaxID=314271 RepID=A3VAB7_9RHOB|nr:dihydropteroate synthase [Maritimibacter alkaliphilus]EAQ14858.1 Dihydropteroate synthase, DHPS [Maritimibacter alkaliphilus HTCC2654]TYP80915.1 dihydropteroate synthase [Maritimibacter alkaliphilus HTCC2654]
MSRSEPIARRGSRRDTALPLAGLRGAWFDEVLGPDDADVRARLSAPRPDLCGLTLDRPRVMGILNVTPDSFSDGGDHAGFDAAVKRGIAMAGEADIIDIGGESTRPGAEEVAVDEEIRRTVPVIEALRGAGVTTPISIDTRKARVAEAALDAGANIVNDVSAFEFDPELADLTAEHDVPVCLMHAKGLPDTMQDNPSYEDVVGEVMDHLERRIGFAVDRGVKRDRIITDPGIGFGKTLEHNLELLRHLTLLHDFGLPVLLGVSRKRFIGTIGHAPEAKDRLGGSLAIALHGAAQGMHIIRVHDTRETTQALALMAALDGEV